MLQNIDLKTPINKLYREWDKTHDITKYHIDHIAPCCSFDWDNLEDIKECNNKNNLRWLLATDNLHKIGEDRKQKLKK